MTLEAASGDRPVVRHVVRTYLERSAAWLYDIVTASTRYEPIVTCQDVANLDEFPFEPVEQVLPVSPAHLSRRNVRRAERWTGRKVNEWRRPLSRLHPDVFHAHFGQAGWACVDSGHRNVVTTFYGYDMSRLPKEAIWRRAYRNLFRHGAAFLAEGPCMRQSLIELGAPEDRTSIQPLIADLSLPFTPPSPMGPQTVLMAGRLVEKKGFVDGLTAFDAVAAQLDDVRLLLIGSGPLEAVIRDVIDRLPSKGRIEWRPFVDRAEYRGLVGGATVLLQPSRTAADGDSEGGAPVTLLDAQAMGTLVVGSTHADIPFVTDPGAAALAPEGDTQALSDCLLRVLSERDSWAERARGGRAHVEMQHGQRSVSAGLEAVYDAVR